MKSMLFLKTKIPLLDSIKKGDFIFLLHDDYDFWFFIDGHEGHIESLSLDECGE